MLSLVIFDCDGVLFDSFDANIAYYNAVLDRLGLPPLDAEWRRQAHFLSSQQLYAAMFGSDPALETAARRAAGEVDYGPYYKLMRPHADLEGVLETLRKRYRLAMATNRSTTVTGVVREFRLDRFIELAVGAHDVARAKPHPDMLEKCLAHFGVAPDAAVYVGDADSDYRAALAAGIRFLAVGEHAPGAHRIRELRELPAWLETAQPSMIMPPSTAIT